MTSPFAIYFPQFYPTPTNDKAWGEGFTDWQLVEAANLDQRWSPRWPARGAYDGSSMEVHTAQMAEAKAAGLGGFALYHYWFDGHQELDACERSLRHSHNVFPWFLIWACERWTRRWVGDPSIILDLSDEPSLSMIEQHCDHLAQCFAHPQYWRWQGNPLFVWYHLAHFKRPEAVVEIYRHALAQRGYEVAMGHFIKNPFEAKYSAFMDVDYLFEPRLFFGFRRKGRGGGAKRILDTARRVLGEAGAQRLLVMLDRFQQKGTTYSAADFWRYFISEERDHVVRSLHGPVQEVLSPAWNNAPRYRERFTALAALSVEDFSQAVQTAQDACELPVLINAWNEWSEGAAIEPCLYQRRGWLDGIRTEQSQS